MSATARRLRWRTTALIAVLLFGACGDDSPDEDAPSPATDDGGPVGAGDGTTLVNPDVALSNVPNQPESPLAPGVGAPGT
jgi:hypothetical protein